MTLYDGFTTALAAFGRKLGMELAIVDGHCDFVVDGQCEVGIDYIREADVVVAWSTVGLAPEDEWQEDRAKALLALNWNDAENNGFTVSMDPETRRVVAHDNRPAELFDSADHVAVWIEALVALVDRIRGDFAERFPCNDFAEDVAMSGSKREEA